MTSNHFDTTKQMPLAYVLFHFRYPFPIRMRQCRPFQLLELSDTAWNLERNGTSTSRSSEAEETKGNTTNILLEYRMECLHERSFSVNARSITKA